MRLFRKILSILSLLLALVTAVLWSRSWGTPLHLSMENEKSLTQDRKLYRNLQFHSLDTGQICIGYASAILDRSREYAELDRMRKDHPRTMFDINFGSVGLWPEFQTRANPPERTVGGFNFDCDSYQSSRALLPSLTGKWCRLSLPHWSLILFFSIPGLLHFRRNLRYRLRLRRGLCPACGYDLRESKGTCPECGAAPSSS